MTQITLYFIIRPTSVSSACLIVGRVDYLYRQRSTAGCLYTEPMVRLMYPACLMYPTGCDRPIRQGAFQHRRIHFEYSGASIRDGSRDLHDAGPGRGRLRPFDPGELQGGNLTNLVNFKVRT